MSAAMLRRAAALIRSRAEAATSGPWHPATTGEEQGDHWSVIDYPTMNTIARIPSDDGSNDAQREPDARHVASWHPAVALAVAKAMDDVAHAWEMADEFEGGLVYDGDDHPIRFEDTLDGGWLAVAREYLGEDQ